jgi:DeoR/GlpR family transcriptional regulator of sugar metabolism
MSVSINRDEWIAALGDAAAPPDPSAITTTEFAELFGVSPSTAARRLRLLVAEGKAVNVYKVVPRIGSVGYRSPAYRLVKATAKAKRK